MRERDRNVLTHILGVGIVQNPGIYLGASLQFNQKKGNLCFTVFLPDLKVGKFPRCLSLDAVP